jgi:hypothetical protein
MPTTTKNIDTGKERSLISRSIDAMRTKSASIAFVILDTMTNEVVTYSKPSRPSGRSSWVREKAIDVPWRDPAEVDPLLMDAARHDPVRRADHETQVREMLIHLVSYYRPDVAQLPQFAEYASVMAVQVHSFHEVLGSLPDARTRWNLILSAFVSGQGEKVTTGKRKAKRSKVTS